MDVSLRYCHEDIDELIGDEHSRSQNNLNTFSGNLNFFYKHCDCILMCWNNLKIIMNVQCRGKTDDDILV